MSRKPYPIRCDQHQKHGTQRASEEREQRPPFVRLEVHPTATGQAILEIGNLGDEYLQGKGLLK